MANLLDIYNNPASVGITTFEQGLEGQAVLGTGGSGIGLNDATSNVYKPTSPSYQSNAVVSGGPYDGAETYSLNGAGSDMTAGGGGHF